MDKVSRLRPGEVSAAERIVYDIMVGHPHLTTNDVAQIAALSKLSELEVSVAIQLLTIRNDLLA
ncbi:hypothetical protein [Paenibacillus mucilaginosus]|uniref:Uncharacterized protein n=3 Tax=Paenibacillus mucilaginosus TaxID=61624 RepID=H6NTA0_9BACL|nr:hypothetical protein [Paenibacillus mucilaginosus]AEI39281.1 hypothetical protein KNP414_00691 [Paenibacillus mucilaginosus KNP414]AFC27562.1 hypothetical protein PM3016_596 [Paenibacillus mucilaginosus 3016]AFH59716.1 hypothetical protein B2K_03070 [Paenibacillus mucilaginosus K02]MCG7217011.1 hypothetical protein [Paenibacillus mucilaginosus]WDM28281.1 hypothetical protein KCX80_03290 [Paenibacillus mucilaginosus]